MSIVWYNSDPNDILIPLEYFALTDYSFYWKDGVAEIDALHKKFGHHYLHCRCHSYPDV